MLATAQGTRGYENRFLGTAGAGHFRDVLGLRLSSIGIGTYLGEPTERDDGLYREAIEVVVDGGINVIDTAINYRHQRSERAVGKAIDRLTRSRQLRRSEVVVCSKAGYIPFDQDRPHDPAEYIRKTYLESGILRPREIVAGCHSLAPRYLLDQFQRSSQNLQLSSIDVYYLHNPEQQLDTVERKEFLGILHNAFEQLEMMATDGRIGVYGTATWNGYRVPATEKSHLSLEELVGIAREVAGGNHHFRVIQLPYNLSMTHAHGSKTQTVNGEPMSILAAAQQLNMAVMTSASIHQGRLAEGIPAQIKACLGQADTDAQRALQFARSTPGVSVALCGMRGGRHAAEAAGLAEVSPLTAGAINRFFSR